MPEVENISQKRRRWPWITLVIFLVLMGGLRLAMRADFVLDYIRSEAELRVSEMLDAEFYIGRLHGDLWSHLTAENIRIYESPDNLTVSLDTLAISYSVIDVIFRRPLEIKQIHAKGLVADVTQDESGRWNILALLPEESVPDEEDLDDDEPFQFVLNEVLLTAPRISVQAEAMLPGEPFAIRDMEIRARVGQNNDGFFTDLHHLGLSVHESRLDAPIQLESEAAWDGRRITLEKLIVAGAYSLIDISGNYDTVTTSVDFESLLDPLAWREVASYMEAYPLRQDMTVSVRLGGSRQNLQTGITINGPGLENLEIDAGWEVMQEPILRQLSITSGRIDAGTLIGVDTLNARLDSMSFAMEGTIPLNEWDRARAAGQLSIRNAHYDTYDLDELVLDISTENGAAGGELVLRKQEETISLDFQADRLWEEDPDWLVAYALHDINPAFWSGMEELDGLVSLGGTATGTGLEPGGTPWRISTEIERIRLFGYPDISGDLDTEITNDSVQVGSSLKSAGAQISFDAGMLWRLEKPEYSISLAIRELNAAEFPGLDDLPTNINGTITASGEGFDPETMILHASLLMDDSEINHQKLETLELDLELRDGIVRIDDAYLSSVPAEGNLSLIQNIFDFRDSGNRLDFDLEIIDIQGFARLAGTEIIRAKGRITGNIRPDTDGYLVFESGIMLEEVQYDTLRVDELEGSVSATLAEVISYQADLEFKNPSLGDRSLKDILLVTDGRVIENGVEGNYEFALHSENDSGLRQVAEYRVQDTIRVRTVELELTDPVGMYRLQKPFDLVLADDYIRVDSLYLQSDLESELTMSLSKAPGSPWTGFLDVQNTNLGQVQNVFMDEPLFHAMFTGDVHFSISEDTIAVSGRSKFIEFRQGDNELDSLSLAFDIADRRITTDATIWHEGLELIRSEFDLPFEPRNPEDLDPAFFEEQVSGYLRIDPLDITIFEDVLNGIGIERVSGEFSLETTLSGVAGSPELTGGMKLKNGEMAGVAVDTVNMAWNYDHSRSRIVLTSRIHSLEQLAADIGGRVPLYIDFQNLEIEGPKANDPLEFSVYTSQFDLAALNVFLDRNQLRDLTGTLDAQIDIGGTTENPEMDGGITVSGGQLYLVANNITLRRIGAEINLSPGHVELVRLSAQSAGSFNGSGSLSLIGLQPENLDLRFGATNFRASNTNDVDIFAGLDLRLTGTLDSPILKGDVRWERGIIFIDDFGDRDVEEVILDDEESDIPEGPDFYDRMEMEVKFSVERNAFVRNRRDPEINLALRGEIDLLKEQHGILQLFGDMEIPSGHVTTFNKRFQLEQGNILFSGDPANPELNIRTLYQPRQQYEDIRIFYLITGTVSDPEFEYESEPVMELEDIISYTIFGRPFHALAGWEQTVSGRSEGNVATSIAVDILLDRIESLASDRLGIDVIEIENTRKGGGSGTSIKAGKFISDRLFVAFLQEIGGSDTGRQVVVEYLIRRNLELIITASDDYRSGVDMLWRYDY